MELTGLLGRFKAWLEHFATKPYASAVLLGISIIESSLAPIPPDVLFIALSVTRPKRSFVYGTVCIVGSVIGAFIGYHIGYLFFESIGKPLVSFYGFEKELTAVLGYYRDNVWLALMISGFTSIPFAIFTIGAGFDRTVDLGTFLAAALAGRMLRFYLLSLLLFIFGPAVKTFLDKHLGATLLIAAGLFVLSMLIVKLAL